MSDRRPFVTTLALILAAGLLAAMSVVLWMVGRNLRSIEQAHRDTSSGLARLDEASQQLRAGLQRAEEDRARLAQHAAGAAMGVESLRGELALLQARLKALESAPPQAAAPAPPPGQDAHQAELPAALRDNPPPPVQAARKALQEKGVAGFCGALGLDAEAQARVIKAHEGFLPRVRDAEKAHAKVAIEDDAVVITIEPHPEEGHTLLAAWLDLLGQALTPAQRQAYAETHGCYVLFERPFGHYTETIRLTGDAAEVKFTHSGTRQGGGPTFQNAGTVAGKGAVDKLPWRHLLTDEAAAKLGGTPRGQF
ncbi:MAG: hypothetical protein FJ290_14365 [Planctomycetes bacterium]|nr:hypothetical protein [Planctomycetota bacterium]